jgi:tRNA (guanine-N7-)-methyltransferase
VDEFRDRDHIKSYAIRANRMSPAQRRAFDELYDRYCVPAATSPLDPHTLFQAAENPVYLEIGFGMGDATAEMAQYLPDVNFLGIEVHKPGVGKLLAAIERESLSNVAIVHDDALVVVEQMIREESLDGVLVFFPDPWPKTRHHKRRIVRDSFVKLLVSRLRPRGFLYAVTDWVEYAEWMMDVLSRADGITNAFGGYAPPQPWRPVTAFEKKGKLAGHEIRELYFVRR